MSEPSDWAPGWAEKIAKAQELTHLHVFKVPYERIRFGDDYLTTKPRCPDCGVLQGQVHVLGCSFEKCPVCFGQEISCDCTDDPPGWKPEDEGL